MIAEKAVLISILVKIPVLKLGEIKEGLFHLRK